MKEILKERIQEYQFKSAGKMAEHLSAPSSVFDLIKDGFDPIQEHLWVLILDSQNNLITKKMVGSGYGSGLAIDKAILYRKILSTTGNRVILAHNHPSHNLKPSKEDLDFTQKVKEGCDILGLELLDHLIFDGEKYFSMRKEGIIE